MRSDQYEGLPPTQSKSGEESFYMEKDSSYFPCCKKKFKKGIPLEKDYSKIKFTSNSNMDVCLAVIEQIKNK